MQADALAEEILAIADIDRATTTSMKRAMSM